MMTGVAADDPLLFPQDEPSDEEPEADEGLPEFEDDDLDADLVPAPRPICRRSTPKLCSGGGPKTRASTRPALGTYWGALRLRRRCARRCVKHRCAIARLGVGRCGS